MKVTEKYSEQKPIVINSEFGVTLTDNEGHRYEIKETKGIKGFEILCDTGTLKIKPLCSNVIRISGEK